MKKAFSILLALILVASLGIPGFASGDASGETAVVEDTGPLAAIVITDDGEDPTREQTEDFELTWFEGGEKTEDGISGFVYTSDRGDASLYNATRTEDGSDFYTIGGDGTNVSVLGTQMSEEAAEWLSDLGITTFDSAAIVSDRDGLENCAPVISSRGYSYLTLDNVFILASGSARSALYADVSDGTTITGAAAAQVRGSEGGTVVIRDSLLETIGAGDVEGEISFGNSTGRARGIQPQGKSLVYLYNSAIVSRTWGAWSTDSARNSLDLVAYRSLGLSQGGYGAYADTSCHLFLFGSTCIGSSDGITASNDGEIYAGSTDNTMTDVDFRALMGKTGSRNASWLDFARDTDTGDTMESTIQGGQTAVQFHMPDMMGSGAKNTKKATLYMDGGALITDRDYLSTAELAAYTEHYAGACIVTKSAQVNAFLDGTTMESWSGVLIHSMINSDTMGNNIADGDEAPGSDYTLQNMTLTGDIISDDYQRAMRVTLANTTLTGAIYSNTCEDWNTLCETMFDGEYIRDPDGYETRWGVELTLTGGAVWNVTETSVLTELVINDGCRVNGTITENPDGTLTVEPLADF